MVATDATALASSRWTFRTADWPPGERLKGLVDAVAQAMSRPFALDVLGPPGELDYRMDGVLLGSTMVARLQTTPIAVSIGRSEAADDNIVVELVAEGVGFDAEQAGRRIHVPSGAALISMGALPRRNRVDSPVVVLILQMPLQRFIPILDAGAHWPMCLLAPQTSGLTVLQRYLQSVIDSPVDRDPELSRLMAAQLQALVLQFMRRAWPGVTEPRGPLAFSRAARLLISERLASPGLNEQEVSAALGISRSYLRKLFAAEGGFATCVRRERLDRALTMLRDPACCSLRVIDIAQACGFEDLSTFNRQFRRRHGAAPSVLRRSEPSQWAPASTGRSPGKRGLKTPRSP